MMKIRLTQDAYVDGNGTDYHDYIDANGNLTEEGALQGVVFYTANAVDENNNEYRVTWKISDIDAYNSGDEDCCNWDEPDEIYSYKDNKPVKAEIEW